MSDENVITFIPREKKLEDDLPVRRSPRGLRECYHERATVNVNDRVLTCQDCEAVLDPIEFLDKLARDPSGYAESLKRIKAAAKKAQADLDDLLRQERNAKSRRRTRQTHEPAAYRHLRKVMDGLPGRYEPEQVLAARSFLEEVDG